jgi:carbonic anhydrase
MKNVEEIIDQLKEGNNRFRSCSSKLVQNNSKEYLKKLCEAQHPIATVVCCVDSRVAPEVLFDIELGKLFVFRIPSSIITQEVLETVEFGAEILKIPLTIVMAHQDCAGIRTKVENIWPNHLNSITKCLHYDESMGNDLDKVAQINIKKSVEKLSTESDILKNLIEKNEHKIVPVFYNSELNRVDFL